MRKGGYERKLSAILAADLQSYSRFMGEQEEATHRATAALLRLFQGGIGKHGGRVVSIAGDGLIADFQSAVNAVRFGTEIQKQIGRRNAKLPEERRMQFRIGINLGDVIAKDDAIVGDSVNIAARLEQMAPAGGLCISRSVYDQIKTKLPLGFRYLGPRDLKNIVEPVEVYQVLADKAAAIMTPSMRRPPEPSSTERPSIAVLPFADLSDGRTQEYLADGLAEDLITNLSRFRELFVIARNSSFVYKGRTVAAKQVGRELGVRYLLEGSIRKAADRLRIVAQLIDAQSGFHLWAERYDRERADVFAAEDEVTELIASTLAIQLEEVERTRRRRVETDDLEAYGSLLRGQELYLTYTRDGNIAARRMFQKAIDLDPDYARACAALSRTHNDDWRYSWSASPDESLAIAFDLAKRSIALDEADARGHSELGVVYLYQKKNALAVAEFERALALNPNAADVMAELADALVYCGRPAEAVRLMERAMRLNPYYPDWYLWILGGAQYGLRQYDEVIATIHKMHNPAEGRRLLAAAYAQLGQIEEAQAQAAEVVKLHPNFSIAHWAAVQPDTDRSELEHFVEGLRKAGLPE